MNAMAGHSILLPDTDESVSGPKFFVDLFVEASSTRQLRTSHAPVAGVDYVVIHRLATIELRRPLSAVVEADDDEFIAHSVDLPQVYGSGESAADALEALKRDLEALWADIRDADDLSDEWRAVRDFLATVIGE